LCLRRAFLRSPLETFFLQTFNPPPQEVSIFCKVEMNCERLNKVLILDYTNRCPDNQGPRVGTTRSKACGEVKTLCETGSSTL
jgi:hypothetical protein